MKLTKKEAPFESFLADPVDHPLSQKCSSQTLKKLSVASKEVWSGKSKVNAAAFADPLRSSLSKPDDEAAPDEPGDVAKLDDEWFSLEASVKNRGFTGKVEVPQPLHYLFSKCDADLTSPPANANPQARLEWLESVWSAGQTTKKSEILGMGVTASDFSDFIITCNGQLAQLWKNDQRVQVVKLSIQLSKMLSPEKPHDSYYPTLFFLVTDVISYFGQLVYDRLVSKCPDLRVNFSMHDVSPQALELCKNWLYKIASVRELVPRFYLEAALLKCYRFSCDSKGYSALIERLTLMIRGFADPVAAAYARMYLVRVTLLAFGGTNPELLRQTARHNYEEFISVYNRCSIKEVRLNGSLTTLKYLELFGPPLNWLIKAHFIGMDANSPGREATIRTCFNEVDNVRHPGLVLHHLIMAAPPRLVASELTRLAHVVTSYNDNEYPFFYILEAFVSRLQISSQALQVRFAAKKGTLRNVLQHCWQSNVDRVANVDFVYFMRSSVIFVNLWLTHFGFDHVDEVFGTVVELLSKGISKPLSANVSWRDCIKAMLLSIASSIGNSVSLAKLPNFLPLFDWMLADQKLSVAKHALKTFHQNCDRQVDAVTENILLHFCSVVSDTVNALTIADEVKQISQFICGVIDVVSQHLGDDFEQKLKFYSECRGRFKKLDLIQVRLTHLSLSLAISTKLQVKKLNSTSSRTKGFMQACVAFAYITIPAVLNRYHQLQLHLLSAQVSFQCQCLGQAEASIEAIMDILKEFIHDRPDCATLSALSADFIPSFMSYMLVVPSLGEKASIFVVTKVLKTVLSVLTELMSSSPPEQLTLGLLHVKGIQLLITASGTRCSYPYHVGGVLSNDLLLYDSDAEAIQKMRNMCFDLIGLVKARLEYFKQLDLASQQSLLALHLIVCLRKNLTYLEDDVSEQYISSLWSFVVPGSDKKVLKLKAYAETLVKGGE